MASSLVRGKYVICKVNGRHDVEVIEDGAVFQRDGIIVEVGKFEALAKNIAATKSWERTITWCCRVS